MTKLNTSKGIAFFSTEQSQCTTLTLMSWHSSVLMRRQLWLYYVGKYNTIPFQVRLWSCEHAQRRGNVSLIPEKQWAAAPLKCFMHYFVFVDPTTLINPIRGTKVTEQRKSRQAILSHPVCRRVTHTEVSLFSLSRCELRLRKTSGVTNILSPEIQMLG